MGYSIHGDETSGADAAPVLAWHLVAGTSDDVTALLDEVLVVIDPNMNPDGRARIRDRPEHEPRRAGAHPGSGRADVGVRGRRRPRLDAARALALRTRQPLPVRHEPRLDRGRRARDACTLARCQTLLAADLRRRPRDGPPRDLPDVPASGSTPPPSSPDPARLARPLRRRPRSGLRHLRLGLLHPRMGRRLGAVLLGRLGVADRRGRDPLRTGTRRGQTGQAQERRGRPLPPSGPRPVRRVPREPAHARRESGRCPA
ncbi:MAG: M14 family zinc carboxypeptidase [Planctomycetota bacterium]